MNTSPYHFEPLTAAHREAVMSIYNHHVANSFAAFPDQPMPPVFFDKMMEMTKGYCAIVVKGEDGQVIGYAMLRPHHFANTCKRTSEVTYFLLPESTRQGIGKAVLDYLIEQAKRLGINNLTASVSSLNTASMAFHRKNGFRECGCIRRVGRKFGQDFDMVWFQRQLDEEVGRSRTQEAGQ
jgi:L-amino acid N-acyltransferase YncA